ncbi:RagB/SusD family nutrient uptake outer membrane protein [Limibacter armeniacum]|uniref:RagB/SusD family nutrient uptake outer membrane protein n=1 Tax=Limibacter armeniacum TaxID=466084 RepID=UPI002FE579FD
MKVIRYIYMLTLMVALGACSDEFLEVIPQDRLVADNYFRNEKEIKSATASLYNLAWFGYNDKLAWMGGDVMSGDLHHTWDQEGQFFFFSFNEGNSHISSGWNSLFRVVSYANSIINDMPRAAEGNVEQKVIDEGLAEARFIRAAAYYFLTEYFGELPIVENSTELVTSNNMLLPKNTQSSLYEFMIRDLEFAAANLRTSDQPGRVTQWSAKGMLAKVYLTRAQHLNSSTSSQDFEEAKKLAADVIENSGLSLMNNYANLFHVDYNNNEETLFALQWMSGNYGLGNSRQANYARNSLITGNTEAWGGGKSASLSLLNAISKNDARRASIIMESGNFYPEINQEEGGYTYNIVTYDDGGQQIESAAPLLNNIKKYVVGSAQDFPGKVSTNQAVELNTYMLRLADVYLVYAEAVLGASASTSDTKALQYFNAIRDRASLPSLSTLTFEDIFNERRVEFAFEGINWFDVKRLYYRNASAALNYLNAQKRGMIYQRIQGDNVPDENSVDGYVLEQNTAEVLVTEGDMFLPIPSSEVLNNALLAPGAEAVAYEFD